VSAHGAATNAGPFQFSLKMKRNLIVVLLFRAFVLAGILRIYVVACDSLNDINNIVREGNEVTRVPQREELEAPAARDELPLSKRHLVHSSELPSDFSENTALEKISAPARFQFSGLAA
jgi:hypothetical protein